MTKFTTYHTLPSVTDGHELEISVSYHLGGYNVFGGGTDARGLNVHFAFVGRDLTPSGFNAVKFMMFDKRAFRVLAKELGRKSDKQTARLVEYVKTITPELVALYNVTVDRGATEEAKVAAKREIYDLVVAFDAVPA